MTRALAFTIAAAALSQTGCLSLTPVGPLGKTLFAGKTPPPGAADKDDASPAAAPPPAPPPPAPTLLVTPGEVSAANAPDAARRLAQELAADEKAEGAMPSYAEVLGGK